MATAEQVGLTSVLAAPLYARGSLLGVLAVARSDLTGRLIVDEIGDGNAVLRQGLSQPCLLYPVGLLPGVLQPLDRCGGVTRKFSPAHQLITCHADASRRPGVARTDKSRSSAGHGGTITGAVYAPGAVEACVVRARRRCMIMQVGQPLVRSN